MSVIKNCLKNTSLYTKYFQGSQLQKAYGKIKEIPENMQVIWHRERDLVRSLFKKDRLKLYLTLRRIIARQNKEWSNFIYSWGYFYQGYDRIGITGTRNTELRFKLYELDKVLNKEMTVLDIGCNAGFLAMEIARYSGHVTGVDWNPYQIEVANTVKQHLNLNNIEFLHDKFDVDKVQKKFSVVTSFANHHTSDGGMRPDLRQYFEGLHHILHEEGVLLFESHPTDVNEAFKQFIHSLKEIFIIEKEKIVFDANLAGGERLFYVLRKAS